jgi:hypothetical protein
MGKIKVKYVPSLYKAVMGFDGKKMFILRWKKQ